MSQLGWPLLTIAAAAAARAQSHFDDAERFARPIYSLRLFSDSRLSFGTQLYGGLGLAAALARPALSSTAAGAGLCC